MRPLRRRAARTARPPLVFMRALNPWVFALLRLFGWYVRFIEILRSSRACGWRGKPHDTTRKTPHWSRNVRFRCFSSGPPRQRIGHCGPETNSSKSVDTGENAGFYRVEPVDNASRAIVGGFCPLLESPLSQSWDRSALDLEKLQVNALSIPNDARNSRNAPHQWRHIARPGRPIVHPIHSGGSHNRSRRPVFLGFPSRPRSRDGVRGCFPGLDSSIVHRCGNLCGYRRKAAARGIPRPSATGRCRGGIVRVLRLGPCESMWTSLWTALWMRTLSERGFDETVLRRGGLGARQYAS
ncbi:hypothetical protein emb_1d0692 [Coriobacteriaceae bacterium EMTCatB1]|nr:hypothetical protein emb_1d0692 [Coriobacteriaceae bacterium EMTCatB1]